MQEELKLQEKAKELVIRAKLYVNKKEAKVKPSRLGHEPAVAKKPNPKSFT